MNAVLVPVRSLSGSKSRLASRLDDEQRRELAAAMLDDLLDAVGAAAAPQTVAVVSSDRALLDDAKARGAEAIHEGPARGLNRAVAMAAERLEAAGVTRLLTVPGDVPGLDAREVDAAFDTDADRYPVVAIPSATGTGTNGLLTGPPSVVGFHFEGASLSAYARAAEQAGLAMLTLPLDSFAVDVDTPRDLSALAANRAPRTVALARAWQLIEPSRRTG